MKKMSLVLAVVVAAFFVGCGGETAATGEEASAQNQW
jgi:PBP1b-binding outer membrane lipoprotein LpoB